MLLFEYAGDRIRRTGFGADRATDTFVIDGVGQKLGTFLGGALFVMDMSFIFFSEVFDGSQDWVRGCLTETA